ncbi:hypothetical protein C0995_004946 [Termitomyces sp. Mi166|nr:hypothetical protein C0995_004946 [Termitomyces sp. Mi166\
MADRKATSSLDEKTLPFEDQKGEQLPNQLDFDFGKEVVRIPRDPPPRPRATLSDARYQRALRATDLEDRPEAGALSLKFDQAWDRRKAEADM